MIKEGQKNNNNNNNNNDNNNNNILKHLSFIKSKDITIKHCVYH